jgi:Cu-processing system ATP-binding protein
MLSLSHVNKSFGKLAVLKDVSLTFEAGKSYALIGPNGSGKTTLIKSVLGMVLPTTGVISVNGKDIKGDDQYRKWIGYMPQIGRYPDNLTIGQLIDMMKNVRAEVTDVDEELIDAFKLYKLYGKPMRTLSGGTRQKVSAALAFLFKAPILISSELLKEKILNEKRKGKLVIITSHILSDLDELATDLVYLFEGQVQYSNLVEVLKQETGETRLSKAIATMIKQKELLHSIAP